MESSENDTYDQDSVVRGEKILGNVQKAHVRKRKSKENNQSLDKI